MHGPEGDDESAGLALMRESADAIVAGVDRLAAAWVVRTVTGLLDAWGRLDDAARAEALAAAEAAGTSGAARVDTELRALFATDPAEQRSTPLEIVRSLRHEATEVLAAAGVPPVERDPFDERSFPDDRYAIVPRSLADLGDDDLAPMLMAWGLGKARVLRARAARSGPGEQG
jgi:hypothetical protein